MANVNYLFLPLVLVLLFLGYGTAQSQQAVSTSYGKKFFIGLMKNFGGLTLQSLKLTIGTTSSNATFVIKSSDGVLANGSVSHNAPVSIPISNEYRITDSSFENREKGIHVYTTNGQTIYVIAENYLLNVNYGVYLVYPCLTFETESFYEYYAISTDASESFHSQILLIGCEDNTTISITPTQTTELPDNLQLASSIPQVAAPGIAHNRTINQLQTLMVTSSSDLTGTRIASNKPLTVIVGHDCASVPFFASGCEPFAIQVPPTFTWGSRFLLASFAGRETDTIFKVFSVKNNSLIYTCEDLSIEHSISATSFQFSTNQFCSLQSSKPVLVVQYAQSGTIDNIGDPAISLVSPTDQYINTVSFASLPMSDFPHSYISVTVTAERFSPTNILLDGEVLNCNWTPLYDSDRTNKQVIGYGCSKELTDRIFTSAPTQHTVSIMESGGQLSVIVYGFAPDKGYAYLTGQEISIGDGIDEEHPNVSEVVPLLSIQNSVNFTSTSPLVFTPALQQKFKELTATAVNNYCHVQLCSVVHEAMNGNTSSVKNQLVSTLVVGPQNVAIPYSMINQNHKGELLFTAFIQTMDSFLLYEFLKGAVMQQEELYETAGFLPIIETTAPFPLTPSELTPSLIELMVGLLLLPLALLFALAVTIVCYHHYLKRRKRTNVDHLQVEAELQSSFETTENSIRGC